MELDISIIDDDAFMVRKLFPKLIEGYNDQTGDNFTGQAYISPEFFYEEMEKDDFKTDVVLVDINMPGKIDGWDIAKAIFKKKPETVVIMCSCDIPANSELASMLPKRHLKISEVISRYLELKDRPVRNVLQIHVREIEMGHKGTA